MYKSVKVEFDKKPNSCKNLTTDDMFVKLPKLQSLVNALVWERLLCACSQKRILRLVFNVDDYFCFVYDVFCGIF